MARGPFWRPPQTAALGSAGPYCDPGRPEFAYVCDLGVSIPASERAFGQGVRAHFDTFVVTTTNGTG